MGRAAQMTGVTGYANNTLSYTDAAHRVYVDLATNDAYLSSTAPPRVEGAREFEDSIEHVPNVMDRPTAI